MPKVLIAGGEPVYQAEIHVRVGSNYDLGVATTHRESFSGKPTLFSVQDAGNPSKIYQLQLGQVTNTDEFGSRANWEIECFVIDERFVQKEKGQTKWARAYLKCNTRSKGGSLRVLDHEQPAPLIQVIEWHQLLEMLKKRIGDQFEFRVLETGLFTRGKIRYVQKSTHGFLMDFTGLSHPLGKGNEGSGHTTPGAFSTEFPSDLPKPLLYRDGRITFDVVNAGQLISCTVFPTRPIVS